MVLVGLGEREEGERESKEREGHGQGRKTFFESSVDNFQQFRPLLSDEIGI